MKKRQILIVVIALAIFLVARLISNYLGTPPERQAPSPKESVTMVFSTPVKTSTIPVMIESTGLLEAVERMELYSEVQGVMLPDGGRFKAGNQFKKGDLLVGLRADDKLAQLVSQRSAFERLITGLMPDLQLDFSDSYGQWQTYLNSIDVNKSLPELPAVNSEKLKRFLTGRSVYTDFYSLRNAEILFSKYRIRAPYTGLLAEANVSPGTVVRQGQNLGVFIKQGEYELRVPIDQESVKWIEKGHPVVLMKEGDSQKKYLGEVSRVNRSIDAESQMSEFFVKVRSDELKDGMFMQVRARTGDVEDAFVVSRSVLFDKDKLFVIQDSLLRMQTVETVHFYQDSAIVRGLEDGAKLLSVLPPGAFEGMKVTIYEEK